MCNTPGSCDRLPGYLYTRIILNALDTKFNTDLFVPTLLLKMEEKKSYASNVSQYHLGLFLNFQNSKSNMASLALQW